MRYSEAKRSFGLANVTLVPRGCVFLCVRGAELGLVGGDGACRRVTVRSWDDAGRKE